MRKKTRYSNGGKKKRTRTVSYDLKDKSGKINPDVDYKKVVKTNRKGGTKTKIRGDALSDIQGNYPSAAHPPPSREEMIKEATSGLDRHGRTSNRYTYTKRQPYVYGDKNLWRRRLKSKVSPEGTETKRKERIVFDDGDQMKKRKQKTIKFGKNKGKIKSKTVHWDKGKRTVKKEILDKIDPSKLKHGGRITNFRGNPQHD